jgi:glycosyltransferase involved in cell wall biosynthesis
MQDLSVSDSHSTRTPQISIVLPVYNETGNIRPLFEELTDTVNSEALRRYQPAEIIFVDDGSTDGSRAVLQDVAQTHDCVRSILLERNFGQSAALVAGIDAAGGEFVVTMDSDMQNDPSDIPKLLDELQEGYDCVSGWRKKRHDSLRKTIPSKIQTYLAWMTGPQIHDFGCTLKAYRRDKLTDIDVLGEGHRYIPAHFDQRGYDVTELPVNHRPRQAGETKYGAKRLVKGSLDLAFNVFWNRFSTRPLHFLGTLGLFFMMIGGLLGAHAVMIKFAFGVPLAPRTPRLIFIALSTLFGLQLLLFGFIAEMVTKLYYRTEDPYRTEEVVS